MIFVASLNAEKIEVVRQWSGREEVTGVYCHSGILSGQPYDFQQLMDAVTYRLSKLPPDSNHADVVALENGLLCHHTTTGPRYYDVAVAALRRAGESEIYYGVSYGRPVDLEVLKAANTPDQIATAFSTSRADQLRCALDKITTNKNK